MADFSSISVSDTVFFFQDGSFFSGTVVGKNETADSQVVIVGATAFGASIANVIGVQAADVYTDANLCIDDLEAEFSSQQTARATLISDLRATY